MEKMGFPESWVTLIMQCVRTVSFLVLINGNPSVVFVLHRGLRQGDPLSPYLFLLCAEVFSAMISNAIMDESLHGIRVAPTAPSVSHLFFADDSIIFARATPEEVDIIRSILKFYEDSSGQQVNFDKSQLLSSRKVPTQKK